MIDPVRIAGHSYTVSANDTKTKHEIDPVLAEACQISRMRLMKNLAEHDGLTLTQRFGNFCVNKGILPKIFAGLAREIETPVLDPIRIMQETSPEAGPLI